jgi:2-keto-3-deoxy-L-rhamnonate aldolase RhmA
MQRAWYPWLLRRILATTKEFQATYISSGGHMAGEENLKERIRSGQTTIGVQVPYNATKSQIEDIYGKDDQYNYISVDSQHNPLNETDLVAVSQAAQDLSIPVHFRIKNTYYTWQIGNWLDLGPSLIEVPQTETEATAQEAVDYFYYRQFGRRSWGGAPRVGIAENPERLDYAEFWNNYGVLMLQVESIQAICNIPRLIRPGVDLISWGPADLTFDREANTNHPLSVSDDACVEYAAKVLEGTDTKLMIRNYDWTLRDKYIEMGATVLLESPKP